MPDLRHLGPQDRPDPTVLLIDAVINGQEDLARRLSQQLVHHQGAEAFEALIAGRLRSTCGEASEQWLRRCLSASHSSGPAAATPAEQLSSLFQRALDEALAPLRQDSVSAPIATATAAPQQPSADPWELKPLRVVSSPATVSPQPAPLPDDLASLRSWLHSDAA